MALGSRRLRLADSQCDFWDNSQTVFVLEADLIAVAVALGAETVHPLSTQEIELIQTVGGHGRISKTALELVRDLISSGQDPLGEAFCTIRTPANRRADGATYTPSPIVQTMVDWANSQKKPARVVDPGTGSARFLMAAGRTFPDATLVGIESDPLAALLARANLAVAGFSRRARVILGDYRHFDQKDAGTTLYIGNPPYVRHHHIAPQWKDWLSKEAGRRGYSASKLAGLHTYFFLATARHARPGDYGAFITASEWLDVNYGSLLRSLVLNDLGGQSITVIDPTAQPFPDAATTAAITTFQIASKPKSIAFRRVASLPELEGLNKGYKIRRDRLSSEARWSYLTKATERPPEGYIELGELCRVHRGQVTGSNNIWIAGEHSRDLPLSVLFPTVTRAREVFTAAGILNDVSKLRCVIDLPVDLDSFDAFERQTIERFLKQAKQMGADDGYIARHRKAWWAVGLRAPAPIISTYMARRPPAFAINKAQARHINIAHGLYPRQPLSMKIQTALVRFLQTNVSQRAGRTYAGGLTKFEPREMERILVPDPKLLGAMQTA